jgi:hypothetical protein
MWLHLPTSVYLPASECSTSLSPSQCQMLAASATVSGKDRQPQYWRRVWGTEPWTKPLSGPTYEPSQADFIVAAWLESLVGSRAKTSLLPAAKLESTATAAASSLTSADSFASWSPSSGCFLKTSRQSSLFRQEQPYSENLPNSGSMRNGRLYERPMLVHRISGTGRSSSRGEWRTPNTRDHHAGGPRLDAENRQTSLVDQAKMWPTPRSNDDRLSAHNNRDHSTMAGGSLTDAIRMWPTPQARDNKSADAEGSGNYQRKVELGWTLDLNTTAVNWANPKAMDLNVVASRYSHPVQETPTPGPQSSPSGQTSRRRLNPAFVEWLMGLPVGYTDFAPLETASWLSRLRWHFESLCGDQERNNQ